MSFISDMFKAPAMPAMPKMPAPAPTIAGAAVESAARKARMSMTDRYGTEDTMLAGKTKGGLGDLGGTPGFAPLAPDLGSAGGYGSGGGGPNDRYQSLLGRGGKV